MSRDNQLIVMLLNQLSVRVHEFDMSCKYLLPRNYSTDIAISVNTCTSPCHTMLSQLIRVDRCTVMKMRAYVSITQFRLSCCTVVLTFVCRLNPRPSMNDNNSSTTFVPFVHVDG